MRANCMRRVASSMQLDTCSPLSANSALVVPGLPSPQAHAMANGFIANDQLQSPMAVSANGNYYSVSSLDGQLHIWDTLSSELVADYTPSAHLSATCVRLSWAPTSSSSTSDISNSPTKKRKKLKTSDRDVQDELNKLSLVALGTANGTILLYSVTKNELHSQLTNGHSERVNDIAWYPATDSLFSCSDDKYVIEWSISKSSVKSKHILDRSVINSIAVIDSKNILTASNSIKWWNWETRQLLKTFSGHATEVRYLKPIIFGTTDEQHNVLLSSAISDRFINAWALNDSKKANAVANFALDDEPISLELAYTSSTRPVYIMTISQSGLLYIFEHLFFKDSQANGNMTNGGMVNGGSMTNGSMKNGVISSTSPIVPTIKLQINAAPAKSIRSKKSGTESVQVPFLCVHLSSEALPVEASPSKKSVKNFFLMIGYGNLNRPTFERISYADCEKCYLKDDGVLERSDSSAMTAPLVVNEQSHMKIKSTKQTAKALNKTTVVGPAGIVTDQSQLDNLLQTVLNCHDEDIVRNTIKKLPANKVPLLMTELQRGLFKKGDHQAQYLKWINLVMQEKIAYLMTMPDISKEFLSLNQLLTARTTILDRCYQLKGRLDIMLSQIKSEKRTDNLTRSVAKLTYESDSSESDIEMDEEDDEEEEDEEEIDALSVDDRDLLHSDDDAADDDDDEDLVPDEEMYESANEREEDGEDDEAEDDDDDDD